MGLTKKDIESLEIEEGDIIVVDNGRFEGLYAEVMSTEPSAPDVDSPIQVDFAPDPAGLVVISSNRVRVVPVTVIG